MILSQRSYEPDLAPQPSLAQGDRQMADILADEERRQRESIELIASENVVSRAVREMQGSVLTNKYAEGYPGRRYYAGCAHVDAIERAAVERAKQLFGCSYANVQPHSGSQANEAVFLAFLKPGDTILGLNLKSGGHLTHGSGVNMSGKWFNAIGYGLRPDSETIDLDEVAELAKRHRPKLIVAGGSSYSRVLDFPAFRSIADEFGALLLVDMAHFAGLVAGRVYPSPLQAAHIVTATTHKTLRGPRGGLILCNDETLAKKIDAAMFPGLQGGPLMHVIGGKAVALGEAMSPEFRRYAGAVVQNCRTLAETLANGGLRIVSGGTDTHLAVVDLSSTGLTGNDVQIALESVGIIVNKNVIPQDTLPPSATSGIRVGSPAATTRGFGTAEFQFVGRLILRAIDALKHAGGTLPEMTAAELRAEVAGLCGRYPQ
ncbi:serine hydroxymethyltransferase [Bradyrhizobium cenepequi]